MENSDLAMCSAQNYRNSFCYSGGMHEGSNLISLHNNFEENENANNKSKIVSDQSPRSDKSQNQQPGSDHQKNLEQTQEKLDDERYVDDDFEDDDDLDEEDEDDDDGIVLDCDDDGESLNESDSPYSLFRKQMKSNRDYLMAVNNKSDETNNFFNGNSIFSSGSFFEISNQQLNLKPNDGLVFNNNIKSDHDSLLSSSGETFPFSNNSSRLNNDKHNFDYNEYQEEKKKVLNILKQNGKLQAFPLCNGCGEPILDRCLLKVEDRPWHSCCLKCKVCAVPLTSSCFLRNEQVYCREDFIKKFGSKCSVCDETIPSTETVRRANDNVYHLNCFRCFVCHEKLDTGDQFYLVNGHKLMCTKDYEQQAVRDLDVDGNSKRPRTSISAKQLETLKSAYNQSSKPARHVREQLSKETGLDLRVVQVWFQNRRAKEKRLNKETEPGKYNHFHRTALSVGNFEHDLSHGPITKRQSRSGNQGNRKRSAGSSSRLHFSRLGTTLSVQKHEILNQSFPFGNMSDPGCVLSPLNPVCAPSNPISLQEISCSNDFRAVFPQVSNESMNNPTSQSLVSLGNAGQASLTCSPTDSNTSAVPTTIADMSCFSRAEPLLNRIEEAEVLGGISGPSKLNTNFSIDDSIKGRLVYPLSRSCMNVYATSDCFGNRFASTFAQPKPALDFFSDTGSVATSSLNEVSVQSRPWLHDPFTNT